ncbi:MAG: hypothetical protein E6Q88_11525 [Lysobacteraceae bacterium]|nr:MAG: hypothetical protein E6Q88_11525 [Xanthomonadaceae bacterium]
MAYPSVDKLQQTLASDVFSYAADTKKAAGRALGTLVEIMTYYTIRAWDMRDHIVIERALPEFGNPQITHNVEFSLHPIVGKEQKQIASCALPITVAKIKSEIGLLSGFDAEHLNRSNQLLTSRDTRRNSCVLAENGSGMVVANIDAHSDERVEFTACKLHPQPFAVFECKRVGVEEGMKKGPQTIEKAKQGAYVARAVSSLQKLRSRSGEAIGYIESSDGTIVSGPLTETIKTIIDSHDGGLLCNFILTVGVVSNHGNWFTSENQNKELRVLAQSYDWLLFLTDAGLAQFIDELLLHPVEELAAARKAFLSSYGTGQSGSNRFTKVQMDNSADAALQYYFKSHAQEVEGWYNVISPHSGTVKKLRDELAVLGAKNWKQIHGL